MANIINLDRVSKGYGAAGVLLDGVSLGLDEADRVGGGGLHRAGKEGLGAAYLDQDGRDLEITKPVSLLELKHLARCEVEKFRMQDRLWARIVYDFALAHRLRTISRTHLIGALTPLYLGWVASYVQETAAMSRDEIARRQEELARSFEGNKPYLVSRWRGPDRFNP